MSPVRVIHASYVNVPATAALPLEPIKLTAMEAIWVIMPVLQHVLLYEGADMPPFEDILQALRSSLAVTLGSFAPLAGKLVHLKDTGDVAISCSASDSVKFVVAESDADVRRLARDEEHDLPVLEQLVPDVDMSKLPAAVLAVQATRFNGGVAVGVTVHHAVADGRSLWTFVEAWATACRGEKPALTPSFDRSVVKLPGGEEEARSILRRRAPNLPLVAPPPSLTEDRTRFTRRTFVVVTALAWTCFARCKQFPLDDDVPLLFFADVRDRLDPPVDRGYIGVCLTRCLAMLPARELRGTLALLTAAAALQDEIRRMNRDPADQQSHLTPIMLASWDRVMNVSGSSAFAAYDIADFGWGKLRRTEPIRMNHDGQVALMRGRDGLGVQVSVSLLQQALVENCSFAPVQKAHMHMMANRCKPSGAKGPPFCTGSVTNRC
ncbi:hypothetical protein QYE76_046622 [Lolium multiflorum]|uniref:Uncharacterized protein n=1 Tax=Lolium multiflorum TaxID=4521 RepID=A0AAD8WZC0_LOLMU|nr:hypothetical protein QYE76_046622 [Lolium multiflorum]